jgi:hypothetical protein
MAISDRDRKLLWARAHNRCACCRHPLTRNEATAGGDVVVTDEAHIVARAVDGPRGADGDRSNIDGYDNLILLCKNDHKMVDDLPLVYPVERLQLMKREHERWAESLFEGIPEERQKPEGPARIVSTTVEDGIPFTLVSSGAELWNILVNVVQCNIGFPGKGLAPAQAEMANEVLASLQEWTEISDEVKADGYRAVSTAIATIDGQLTSLWAMDLFLLARALPRRLQGGSGAPVPWKVAELLIHTADSVRELQKNHSMPRADKP